MRILTSVVAGLAICLSLASCGGGGGAVTSLRFSGIPDRDKDKLLKQYSVVTDYLAKKTGLDVQFIVASEYTAAVTALAANKVDLVWLGGVTSVQAEERTDGNVTFLATRDTDLRFKSYFIANESLGLSKVNKLEDLKDAFANHTFTFGSKSSTSGHIMPRHFLAQAGIIPEQHMKERKFQLQGSHSATLENVANGSVDMGALNYTVWDGADAATKAKAPVVYETPPYVDYCMVAHNRLGKTTLEKLRRAFVELDASNEEHAEVLAAFSATKFVAANTTDWDGIRAVLNDPKVKEVLR